MPRANAQPARVSNFPDATECHDELQWVLADAVPADVENADLAHLSSPDVLLIL